MILDTVYRFLATNNLRFFLNLSPLFYEPYQQYIRDSDNIVDEGEWVIRIGPPDKWLGNPNFLVFNREHYDILFASLCPYTAAITGDWAVLAWIGAQTNDDITRAALQMLELFREASAGWVSLR